MNVEKVSKAYYKLPDGSELYKMTEIDNFNVNVTLVSDTNIIIYDTRINRDAVSKKFDDLDLADSTEEEFYKKYNEIESRKK